MNKNIFKILLLIFLGSNLYALDINEAVEIALLNNNNLKKHQYIYEESKIQVDISKSSFKPKINLSYNYIANSENLGQGKDSSNANAIVSYNLFNGFKDKYKLKSSEDQSKMLMYNYQATKNDLILNVKQNYITYLKSLKNIDTQNNAFKLLEQQYKDSKNRFDQGLLARNDLLYVNAQMLQSKQNLARSIADSKISKYKLKNILGGYLNEDVDIKDLRKEIIKLEDYNEEDLNKRSELKAIKFSINSIINKQKSNETNFLPSLDLSLGYTKFGDNAFLDTNSSSIDDNKSAKINLKLNLFNGGKDSLQNIVYKKKLMQLKEDLKELQLSIKLQFENAMEEFKVSKLNYETAKVSLEQSKENYKIVNNRFKEGLSSSTDLINANYLLTQAKQSFYNAYYDRFLGKSSLDRIFER
ncbi:MAG: TolC family protein [Arcobacter sp.]|nr:TolC family protein [Arcobacter sp.]